MIYKSYEIEQDNKILKDKIFLFYGENLGLKNDLKNQIKKVNKNSDIIFFSQDEILKNQNILIKEISNDSLFQDKKVFFIDQTNDKILQILEEVILLIKKNELYLFAEILDKRSKLRNVFEKSKNLAAVACYPDNEIAAKRIVNDRLRGFDGLTPFIVNLILEKTEMNRVKLNNEISKIETFFNNKKIEKEKLEILLNIKESNNFNSLSDKALIGNKVDTNKLLSETILDKEKTNYYLNIINQRLDKLYEINRIQDANIENRINNLKPPIFWKDRPNIVAQAKKWKINKIKKIKEKTYDLEICLKSNYQINKDILLKKLILDICEQANS